MRISDVYGALAATHRAAVPGTVRISDVYGALAATLRAMVPGTVRISDVYGALAATHRAAVPGTVRILGRGPLAVAATCDKAGVMAVTYDDIVAMTADWPGVTADRWYGTPGLKVGGKGFARMWSEREHKRDDVHDTEVLVVLCDLDEKHALMDASKGVLFETPHYEGHGGMLVRLDNVAPDDLIGLLEDSYRTKASAKLLAAFDAD